jgi:hypothetical protein
VKAIKILAAVAAVFCLYCAGAFAYGAASYYFGGMRDHDIAVNNVINGRVADQGK